MLDGGIAGAWDLRKHAKSSPSMFLWRICAAVVRPTPSELEDRLNLVFENIFFEKKNINSSNIFENSTIFDISNSLRARQSELKIMKKNPK